MSQVFSEGTSHLPQDDVRQRLERIVEGLKRTESLLRHVAEATEHPAPPEGSGTPPAALLPEPAGERAGDAPPPRSAADPVIFVIDEDNAARTAVCELLRDCGYPVQAIASLADLREHPPEPRPSLVVLDPGRYFDHAVHLVRRAREVSPAAPLPVLLLSPVATPVECERALAAGAAGCMAKPSAPAELVSAVREIVGPPTRLPPAMTGCLRTT